MDEALAYLRQHYGSYVLLLSDEKTPGVYEMAGGYVFIMRRVDAQMDGRWDLIIFDKDLYDTTC
jgi:hypothetical protein